MDVQKVKGYLRKIDDGGFTDSEGDDIAIGLMCIASRRQYLDANMSHYPQEVLGNIYREGRKGRLDFIAAVQVAFEKARIPLCHQVGLGFLNESLEAFLNPENGAVQKPFETLVGYNISELSSALLAFEAVKIGEGTPNGVDGMVATLSTEQRYIKTACNHRG